MTFHSEWIQETLYGAPALQFLASIAVVAATLLLFRFSQWFRDVLSDRYSTNVSEAVVMVLLAVEVVVAAILVAEIWAFSFVVEEAIEAVVVDRWTGVRAALSVAVLASGYMLARTANRLFDRLSTEGAITNHQREVAYHVIDAGLFVIASLVILSVWGIDLTNIVLSAGVATAVLGLAAQKTVAAIVAGFLLLFSRPFRTGDWIKVASGNLETTSGIVQDITISHTKIRTFNDEHVMVPNDEVTARGLTNYSRSNRLRIDVEIGVDYETDLERARAVVQEAVDGLEIVSETRDPKVVLDRFDDSSIVLELHFWIDNPSRRRAWRARTAAIEAVKEAFDREGITIPFPQRTHEPRGEGGFGVAVQSGSEESGSDPRFAVESDRGNE